jgi:membrane protease YdiL (CAAX protease family)
MVRRLLRGKVLYVLLSVFVAMLFYLGGTRLKVQPLPKPSTEMVEQLAPELRMAEVDIDTLKRATANNPRLSVSLAILSLFMTTMMIGGVLLTLWALVTGRIRAIWHGPFHRVAPWTFGELLRVLLLGAFFFSLMPFVRVTLVTWWPVLPDDPFFWMMCSMVVLDLLVLLAILAFASTNSDSSRKALGLTKPKLWEGLGIGLRSYMAVFPWLFLLLFLTVRIARYFDLHPPVQPIHQLLFVEQSPAVLVLTILLASFIGPVAEEALFRGVIFGMIRRKRSRWTAMLISGAVFSAVHTNLIGFLPIMALGCVLADLYERTGSLISPIAVHILHNTFLLQLAIVFRAISQG